MSLISYFQSEESAYCLAEKLRWPNGPTCSHCGNLNSSGKLRGVSTHPATWKCYDCRRPFNVRLQSLFEGSHVPLHVWFQAIYIFIANKEPISIKFLERSLLISEKMARNIRQLLADEGSLNCCVDERKSIKSAILKNDILNKKFNRNQASSKLWYIDSLANIRFDKFSEIVQNYDAKKADKQFIVLLTLFLSHKLSRSHALKHKNSVDDAGMYLQ